MLLLLRDDIYQELRFADKNKLTDSLVEPLAWSSAASGPGSLKSIIEARIRFFLDLPAGCDSWNAVFTTDHVADVPPYRYMVDRTFWRPRDLIKFANVSLEGARVREEQPDQVAVEDIEWARPTYSSFLLEELDNEIHPHHPTWRYWLELLRLIGRQSFSRRVFQAVFTQNAPLRGEAASPKEVLEVLYRFGVVSFARPRADGQSTRRRASRTRRSSSTRMRSTFEFIPGYSTRLALSPNRSRCSAHAR